MNDSGLCVYHGDTLIFSSSGKWLHPLFDLELFLASRKEDPSEMRLEDKIIGKAAAMLMIRMGFRRIHGRLMSRPAREVLEQFGVRVSWDELVPLIQCRTEAILANIDDPEEASLFLLRRGGREVDAALIAESVTVSLEGREILRNLSFAVTRGEKVILRGAAGSGKTILVKALLGEIPLSSGEIFCPAQPSGQEAEPPKEQESREETGATTVGETVVGEAAVRYSDPEERRMAADRILELTETAGLKNRPLRELSPGERRRAELARLLVREPELLLLDGPAAGLEPEDREAIYRILGSCGGFFRNTVVVTAGPEEPVPSGWRCHELREGRLRLPGRDEPAG